MTYVLGVQTPFAASMPTVWSYMLVLLADVAAESRSPVGLSAGEDAGLSSELLVLQL